MSIRWFPALSASLVIVTALAGQAKAQVYYFNGDPYTNANFGAVVRDQVTYEFLGDGRWNWKIRVVRADDGFVFQADKVEGFFEEVSRGSGEVELRSKSGGVPKKLTDNGTYIFRTYPSIPIPEGIDPDEKRWWRNKGAGKWISNRPQ